MALTFSGLLKKIITYPRGFWQRHVVRWTAVRTRVDAVNEKTYAAALSAPEPSRRWQAAAGLARGHQHSADTIAALVAALADPEPIVRWEAAAALAAQDASHVFPTLTAALDAANPLQRAGAAEALGRAGGEAASQVLAKRLADTDPRVRRAVAAALGHIADPTQVTHLLPLLTDPAEDVRRAAAHALGQIGDPASAAPLAAALAQYPQSVLERRSLAAALAHAPHPDAQAVLLQALGDPDPQVRGYAAKALGQIGSEVAHEALTSAKTDRGELLRGTVGDAAARALTLLERRGRRSAATAPQEPAGQDAA